MLEFYSNSTSFDFIHNVHKASAVPHPDAFWYRLNGMGAQKMCPRSSYNTFSIAISHKNSTKYSLLILKNKNFFQETQISFPRCIKTLNIFGPSGTTIEGFWVSLNYPILNFKKSVFPKNFRMRHCSGYNI